MSQFRKQLKKFLDGKLSQEEAKGFTDILNSEEGESSIGHEVQSAWDELLKKEGKHQWDSSILLKRILKENGQKKRNNTNKEFRNNYSFLRWAAGIAIFAFAGLLYYSTNSIEKEKEVMAGQESHKTIVKMNPKGQKSKITLPDGSTVFLNSESKLVYKENFLEDRRVHLTGEAFFEVAEDSIRPFMVSTGRLVTTALGTSFNIDAYPDTEKIQVSLASGKVLVRDSLTDNQLVLDPGETTGISEENYLLKKYPVDIQKVIFWKDGILYFDKTPLAEVIPVLERWYGVDIEISGSQPQVRCSGTFNNNEYLSNILNVLGHSIGFSYTIKGKRAIIHFKQ